MSETATRADARETIITASWAGLPPLLGAA